MSHNRQTVVDVCCYFSTQLQYCSQSQKLVVANAICTECVEFVEIGAGLMWNTISADH